jgi:HemY protein
LAGWQQSKSVMTQYQRQSKALLAILGGDWNQSAKFLGVEPSPDGDSSEIQQQRFMHALLAAHTAHAQGDFAERDRIVQAPESALLQLSLLGPLLVAQWHLESGDIKTASDSLKRALDADKNNARARSMLVSVHIASENWVEAENCWSALKKAGQPYHTGLRLDAFDFQRHDDFYNPILTDALMLAKFLARRTSGIKDFKELALVQRRNVTLLMAWAKELRALQRDSEGAAILAAGLDETWDSGLFAYWSEFALAAPQKGLERAVAWSKNRSQDPHIQEVLGLLASQTEQWGEAKNYFEAALKILPEKDDAKVRVYRQLALVWKSLGDDHRALQYFSQAEALASH